MNKFGHRCEDCVYFVLDPDEDDEDDDGGLCRRFPPVPMIHGFAHVDVVPSVTKDHWCGEFLRP